MSCRSCFYVLDIKLLLAVFANIVARSVGCLFILFMVFFAVPKLVSFISPICLFLFLLPCKYVMCLDDLISSSPSINSTYLLR